ncbi:MAG: hypothetical protein EXS33_00005 [Pedosphaera sp.]|nr:hypothetical protein [Pedosphaera sp.]
MKITTTKYRAALFLRVFPASILLVLSPLHLSGKPEAAQTLFSPEPAPRPKLLFDYYHHVKPSTKVGDHLVTGGWADNVGRYGWDDFSHTNSFDPVFVALEKEFAITIHEAPFAAEALAATDAVVIVNPDSPALVPNVPVISDEEIESLTRFVHQGGSLMVMINSDVTPPNQAT